MLQLKYYSSSTIELNDSVKKQISREYIEEWKINDVENKPFVDNSLSMKFYIGNCWNLLKTTCNQCEYQSKWSYGFCPCDQFVVWHVLVVWMWDSDTIFTQLFPTSRNTLRQQKGMGKNLYMLRTAVIIKTIWWMVLV